MTTIKAATYPINFNEKGYSDLTNLISKNNYSSIFILVDDNTFTYCYPRFIQLLETNKPIEVIQIDAGEFQLVTNVASKHKLSIENLNIGDYIFMYGVVVGKAVREIQKGESITTFNISHQTESYELPKFKKQIKWEAPKSSDFLKRTFLGYHRDNGADLTVAALPQKS